LREGRVLEIRVLGPVCAVRDGRDVRIGGPRERAVLAALVLAGPGGRDSVRLVDDVWGAQPPRTAERTLQAYLSRLRTRLGAEVVVSRSGRHRLENVHVDLWRFNHLRERARQAPDEAVDALREAVALWAETVAFGGAALEGASVQEAALARARLDTLELLLAHQDDLDVTDTAERLLAEDPHREGVWERLAVAQHRLGRRADALAALRRARHVLVRDLGADPSPVLAALEQQILSETATTAEEIARAPLPTPLTSLVGREVDVKHVCELLRSRRLVCLVGVGGVGKTRLALAAAVEHVRVAQVPVYFVSVAGATGKADLARTVLAAVGGPGDEPTAALPLRLGRRPGLLVLDDCEDLVTEVADLARWLLGSVGGLRVLATSRTRLGVTGEALVDVAPLAVPQSGPGDAVGPVPVPALRLFLDRAADATDTSSWGSGELAAAAEVCRRLDGIPLALEVTAGRLRYAEVAAVRDDLKVPAAAATTDAVAAALDRSLRRLTDSDRQAAGRLALLTGPLPPSLASAVAGDVAVRVLVDSSLVSLSSSGVRMYGPVRRHVLATTPETERADNRRLVVAEMLALAEKAAPQLVGPDEIDWLQRLDQLHPDMRSCLAWAADGEGDHLGRLAAALGYLWVLGWGAEEGAEWVGRALQDKLDAGTRCRLLVWSSYMDLRRGRHPGASDAARKSVTLARQVGDDVLLGDALHALAMPDKVGPRREDARAALLEAVTVRRRAGDVAGAAMSLGALADLALAAGMTDEAAEGYSTGLPLMRLSGSARGLLAYLHSMAELELVRGDLDRVDELVTEAAPLAVTTRDHWHVALLAVVRARTARARGASADEQRSLTRRALLASLDQTDPVVTVDAAEHAAGVLLDLARPTPAARLLEGARLLRRTAGLAVPAGRDPILRHDRTAAGAPPPLAWPAVPDPDWLAGVALEALA
jgi:predicted ATPase/DNA-binding SARP family transcriptional activator